jgi:hypothetical protein
MATPTTQDRDHQTSHDPHRQGERMVFLSFCTRTSFARRTRGLNDMSMHIFKETVSASLSLMSDRGRWRGWSVDFEGSVRVLGMSGGRDIYRLVSVCTCVERSGHIQVYFLVFRCLLPCVQRALLASLGGMCFYELTNLTVDHSSSFLAVTTKRYPFYLADTLQTQGSFRQCKSKCSHFVFFIMHFDYHETCIIALPTSSSPCHVTCPCPGQSSIDKPLDYSCPAKARFETKRLLPRIAVNNSIATSFLLLSSLYLLPSAVTLFRSLLPAVIDFLEAHSPLSSRCPSFNANTANMGRKFFVGGNFKM